MKTVVFESREQWLADRLGRITGTRVKDIISENGVTKDMIIEELTRLGLGAGLKKTLKKSELEMYLPADAMKRLQAALPKKKGPYELIAERLMVSEADFEGYVPNETPMDRGTRLQGKAIERFTSTTGKLVDESLVMWMREDNDRIAISPDGVVKDAEGLTGDTEAVETKCLSAANHIEAYITQQIPSEYHYQSLQYFVVNDKLQTLYFCFYDPRIPCKEFFYLKVNRVDAEAEIKALLEVQRLELDWVDGWVAKLSGETGATS